MSVNAYTYYPNLDTFRKSSLLGLTYFKIF